ncbi:MAG: Ig-like domain-containing protein, partial [Acidimicrobiia bacterium]|nr:Ig-like domain-containing protein [Acidimicrobiia bacterium]
MPARTRRRFWIFFPAFTLACSVVVTFASGTVPADATVPGLIGRIAFAADIDGRTDIWVRDFVSNVPVNVTGNIDEERQPAWSPDGTKLAYASYGWLTGTGSIAVIDDTGGNFEILTDTAHDDWWPSWSRDGQTIVYTSTEDGPDQDIWVVDVDSKVRTNLTPDSSGDDYQPEWSPDGSHIVFVSDRSGSTDIWTMASGGAGPVNLTAAAASDWAPSWSPDGSQIAFVSDRDSALGDVHVMESDGTSVLRLTVNAEVLGRTAWSPDGTLIGFTSIKDGDLDVWMVAADGSSAPGHLTDHPANEFEVAWEPVSRPPVAVDDEFTVGVFDSLSGNLLDNDSDPDGDELTVVDISSAGEPGSFTYQADGSFTYTPPGFPEVCHSPNRTASAASRP